MCSRRQDDEIHQHLNYTNVVGEEEYKKKKEKLYQIYQKKKTIGEIF